MQRNHFAGLDQLTRGLADYTTETLRNALTRSPKVSLVVPGGSTPRHYLPVLARCALPWDNITITLSDERWVDSRDEASNEHLVTTHFLEHLPDTTRFIGLKTPHHTPDAAIHAVHQRLAQLPLPFSLTILGLGEDGHIASLFPGMNPELPATHHCIAVQSPVAPSPRISLSLKTLTDSEQVALVVVGKAKRQLLDRLSEQPDPQIPLVWLLQRRQSPIVVFEADAA